MEWIKKIVLKKMYTLKQKGQYFDITGNDSTIYMRRYFLLKKKWLPFGIYIHEFFRSDNDTYHDHPWWFISYLVDGVYFEHRYFPSSGRENGKVRYPGSFIFRQSTHAHRISLFNNDPIKPLSLVVKGRKKRKWGYYVKDIWQPHAEFTRT